MQSRTHSLFCVLVALFLASCEVNVSVGGPRYVGAGVTFITPLQTSNVAYGPEGIKYESEDLKAETDGKMLVVNGKSFGTVQAGDTVDLTTSGIVKVNGAVRENARNSSASAPTNQEELESTFRDTRAAAERGDAHAQNKLGEMYANDHGVARDDAQAVAWFRKAAEQGYAPARTNLGLMYMAGRGVKQDNGSAVAWFRLAADEGYAQAQYNLGVMYRKGLGVEQDDAQAVAWYRTAADQGFAEAQNNLGFMYANGLGVAQDDVKAVEWYRTAADQGHALAKQSLRRMEASGRGK